MKNLTTAIVTVLLALSFSNVYAVEMKTVCHDKVVKGKVTQVCKKIKVHKKADDATKIPSKGK
jgi:hypothetical protein